MAQAPCAAAFKSGFEPSNIDTETYIFLSDVVTQSLNGAAPAGWPTSWGSNVVDYGMDPNIVNVAPWSTQMQAALTALPSLSIVTPLENLFDPSRGIYANPGGDGDSWEVPTSLELINPDGTQGFQIDAGLRVRGGFSRSTSNPKHAFRLFFRAEYGDAKLDYPLFGTDGVDSFDKMDLRTAQNYSWAFQGDGSNTMVEEVWNRDTSLALGEAGTHSRWYHLYINGQYWGLYQTEERPDAAFGASYFGGQREEWDTIKVDPDLGYNIEATDGDMVAWTQLYNTANTLRNPALTQTQRVCDLPAASGQEPGRNPQSRLSCASRCRQSHRVHAGHFLQRRPRCADFKLPEQHKPEQLVRHPQSQRRRGIPLYRSRSGAYFVSRSAKPSRSVLSGRRQCTEEQPAVDPSDADVFRRVPHAIRGSHSPELLRHGR